jgi:hypothetical protein
VVAPLRNRKVVGIVASDSIFLVGHGAGPNTTIAA